MGKIEEIYGENQSKFFFKNLYKARKKLFNLMLKYISTDDQIIDIGTTPVSEKHENFFYITINTQKILLVFQIKIWKI